VDCGHLGRTCHSGRFLKGDKENKNKEENKRRKEKRKKEKEELKSDYESKTRQKVPKKDLPWLVNSLSSYNFSFKRTTAVTPIFLKCPT